MTVRHRATLLALAVLILATCLILALRESAPDAGPNQTSRPIESSIDPAKAQAVQRSPGHVQLASPLLETRPLAALLLDPMVDPARKWRALHALGAPQSAQMQAVNSGDPILIYGAVLATIHCSALAVQFHGKDVRQIMTAHSLDPKTGGPVPPNEDLVRLNEALSKNGPQLVLPIVETRADIAREMSAARTEGQQADPERTIDLYVRNAAPLSASERASYDAVLARSAAECAGGMISDEFGRAWRSALDRLVAQGVTSALLFNSRAGWQSAGYDLDLAPRDFDVLERAFLDAQQDTWAKLLLLSPRATGQSPPDLWPDDVTMISAYMSLDQLLGPLTACALGIYECGPNSNYFRAFCLDYGGCDQPDLAALIRHVFQRDGLDPTIVDREIDRVVAIYRNRDFAALGIRRKSPG